MNKYRLDTDENKSFLGDMREDLLEFGRSFPSAGGGAFYLGDGGCPMEERPRETWITSRMAHVYSMGSMLGFSYCGDLADQALKGLSGELEDKDNGGWYAGRASDGSILPDKQCYAHAFVILAASSAMLAGRDGAGLLLHKALEVYDRYFWNEEEGLAADTWDTGFTALSGYRGLNANMHTVEAFLAVADATSDEKYRKRAGRIIERVIEWASANEWRIPEHYSSSWEPIPDLNIDRPDDPFKPYGATPGHGIEWARLITEWAASAFEGDATGGATKYFEAAAKLYERAVDDAWEADGAPGFCYTTDWSGKPVVHDRMHWTLAEAINTSAVLYRVTKDFRYASDYEMFMEYLDNFVLDHDKGSWFHQLDDKNRVTGTVWPGKPDIYHAFQATLIPYVKDPGISVATAVKRGRI